MVKARAYGEDWSRSELPTGSGLGIVDWTSVEPQQVVLQPFLVAGGPFRLLPILSEPWIFEKSIISLKYNSVHGNKSKLFPKISKSEGKKVENWAFIDANTQKLRKIQNGGACGRDAEISRPRFSAFFRFYRSDLKYGQKIPSSSFRCQIISI